ncbi:MFS family permease [Streptomyces luteogriseus]|uniref:MFS family permease n=1 Tax=Streptomyces luteogriseus TaxID=68233 RepID=A0A7W7DI00_9ACTN|nr:MFS family permease [Streptomyces luteogriseus]
MFGLGGQLVNVTIMAVRQAVTPDGLQGRAAATITFAGMGLTPLGSLAGGFLAEEWGLRTGLLVTAAGMLLSPRGDGPLLARPPGAGASGTARHAADGRSHRVPGPQQGELIFPG